VNELALFAGAGGGILGGHLLGWRTVCAVERDAYAAAILAQRQNDGCLEPFPIWSDVETFDGKPWCGIIDVVSGGFPCQDISAAGKGAGIEGKRSGLWKQMARIIGEVRPRYAFVENSPCLVRRGLGRVLGDLAHMGFDAKWGIVSAANTGAPHLRERIWILAHSQCPEWGSQSSKGCDNQRRVDHDRIQTKREEMPSGSGTSGGVVSDSTSRGFTVLWGASRKTRHVDGVYETMADSDGARELQPEGQQQEQRGRTGDGGEEVAHSDEVRLQGGGSNDEAQGRQNARGSSGLCDGAQHGWNTDWWESEPAVGRVANGVAYRVDRIKAIGNGQVPAVVKLAWETLSEPV
jgi:DNA (cytosine-5)-methyltransferase 1